MRAWWMSWSGQTSTPRRKRNHAGKRGPTAPAGDGAGEAANAMVITDAKGVTLWVNHACHRP